MTLEQYRHKLIQKVKESDSPREIDRYIHAAMKALQHRNVHGHLIARFVQKMLHETDAQMQHRLDGERANFDLAHNRFVQIASLLSADER